MADKFFQHLQEGEQSYVDDSKKTKQVVQKLQPIEYFDLIPLAKEEHSSNNELEEDDCKQIFFIRKRKKIPKKIEKNQLNPFMKELIINKEEPIAETDSRDTWEFKEKKEFFRQRNQLKANIPGSQPKF